MSRWSSPPLRPHPSALRTASFRVHQRKKVRSFSPGAAARNRSHSAGGEERRESVHRKVEADLLDIDTHFEILGDSEQRQIAGVTDVKPKARVARQSRLPFRLRDHFYLRWRHRQIVAQDAPHRRVANAISHRMLGKMKSSGTLAFLVR